METRMKNKWLAAALNIVPGLGYLYAGVRTPFAILLLVVWPLMFASGWITPMEDIETMNSVPYNVFDILMIVAVVAAFIIDGYFEAIRVNGSQAKPAKTKKKVASNTRAYAIAGSLWYIAPNITAQERTMTKKQVTETQNSTSEWQGAFSAFEKAFDAILKNPVPAAVFLLTYVTLAIIGSRSTELLILASLAQLIFLLAIPLYGLALADDKKPTIKYLLQIQPKKYIFLLLATVLYLLIVGVSFLLLVFPIVWALAWTYNVGFLVADKGLSPIAAIKESKCLGASHKGKIWGIVGVSFLGGFGAGIIGTLPYGQYVANFAMGVVTLTCSVAGAMLYRWLQKNKEVTEIENA